MLHPGYMAKNHKMSGGYCSLSDVKSENLHTFIALCDKVSKNMICVFEFSNKNNCSVYFVSSISNENKFSLHIFYGRIGNLSKSMQEKTAWFKEAIWDRLRNN